VKGWIDFGSDVCWEEHGGVWGRKANDGTWFVILFNESEGTLYASLRQVSLSVLSEKQLEKAFECCDVQPDASEVEKVAACVSYGHGAPLGDWSGIKYAARLRGEARREAEALMKDSKKLEEKLDRPVNKIGSTARDFREGNVLAGLERYASGEGERDMSKDIMARLCGVPGRRDF